RGILYDLEIYKIPYNRGTPPPPGPSPSTSASPRNLFTAAPPAVPSHCGPPGPLPGGAGGAAVAVACRDREVARPSRGSPLAVAMRVGAVLRLCSRPELRYQQGQRPEPGIREYFYYVDHQGQLFLDDTKVKNFVTCFKGTALITLVH
uniref:Uncharacterized protein n=1 Tax=Geospiza parvula TaxID=87175 RepID=A0A8C3MAJ7_GEOPR